VSDQKSKLYSVRVPAAELERFEEIFAAIPNVSPALIFRAVLLSKGVIGVRNALAKHAGEKFKCPEPEGPL
jgi:hypothetical protein